MAHRTIGRLTWSSFPALFWGLVLVYLGHRLAAWGQLPRPDWITFYLDDFLCLPLVLSVTLWVMRFFYGPHVRFSWPHVAFAVIYVSLIFEIVLPQYMDRYTADALDVFLYALGGGLFYLFLNK